MNTVALGLIGLAILLPIYTYAGYPLALRLLTLRRPRTEPVDPAEWPHVSISLPAYNEETQIAAALDSLLQLDYPADRLHILVVSDASSDRTDEIVREYAPRGVHLLRATQRSGKTAAENLASLHLTGNLILNTDASVRVHRDALKHMVRTFGDPTVGLASARDVSVAKGEEDANVGEAGYVGYEMSVRDLETRFDSIVGASGCCYLIRADLHSLEVPDSLSRDFAAALKAREHGYRAVSVNEAICFVPRTASLGREYQRKVRTMTRGMETLLYKRHLLNPFTNGRFAWMLWSHKICRWLIPWAAVGACAGLALLSTQYVWAMAALALGTVALIAGVGTWLLEERVAPGRWLRLVSFGVMGNIAAIHAGIRAVRGDRNPIWEPTRRDVVEPVAG